MEDAAVAANSWITIVGTLITTAGTVLVALITTKTRRDQKKIQRETEDCADDNKKEILTFVSFTKHTRASRSTGTPRTAGAIRSSTK